MKQLTIVFSILMFLAGIANSAEIAVTYNGDTATLSMSENLSVSAVNFSVTGGMIKSITYTGEADKLAAYCRNKAIVYSDDNNDLIENGEFATIEFKGYGARDLKLYGVVAASNDLTPVVVNVSVSQTSAAHRNTLSAIETGNGKTVMR
jgi:hypothetical protein